MQASVRGSVAFSFACKTGPNDDKVCMQRVDFGTFFSKSLSNGARSTRNEQLHNHSVVHGAVDGNMPCRMLWRMISIPLL